MRTSYPNNTLDKTLEPVIYKKIRLYVYSKYIYYCYNSTNNCLKYACFFNALKTVYFHLFM